jgi:hypothetical protein
LAFLRTLLIGAGEIWSWNFLGNDLLRRLYTLCGKWLWWSHPYSNWYISHVLPTKKEIYYMSLFVWMNRIILVLLQVQCNSIGYSIWGIISVWSLVLLLNYSFRFVNFGICLINNELYWIYSAVPPIWISSS